MDADELVQVLDRPRRPKTVHAAVPTGSFGLDLALGGGFPSGRITELYGHTGTAKTTVALHAAARAQANGTVLWADSGSFSVPAARAAQIDPNRMVVFPATDVATTLRMLRVAARDCSLMVLDTATGLYEVDSFWEELGLLTREIRDNGPAVVMTSNWHVSPHLTGQFSAALRQAAPCRVRLRHDGYAIRAQVVRNPLMPPVHHPVRFRVENGVIDALYELVLLADEFGLVEKNSTWWYFNGFKLGQGISGSTRTLANDPGFADEIRDSIRTIHGG